MKLSKLEQETIILFNEAEDTATVYTHNDKLIKQLDTMCADYPEICKIINNFCKNQDTKPKTYNLSKKLIRVKNPHKISDKSKENLRIRITKVNEARKNGK